MLFMFDEKDMTEQEFKDFVQAHEWVYAKTMPANPHCYVVKDKCRDLVEFYRAVLYIRKHGKMRRFFRKGYTYYDMQPFTYWTMGNPLEQTKIINRALL